MLKKTAILTGACLLMTGCSYFSEFDTLKAPCSSKTTASLNDDPCTNRQPVNTAALIEAEIKS